MSRSRRRTRFRTTAPPILFEVTKPTRNNPCSCAARTPKTMARPRWAVPSDLTRANSTGRTKRFAFEKDKPGEAGVGIHATIPQPRQSRHPRPALVCPFSSTTGLGSTTPVQQKSSRRNAAGRLRLKPERLRVRTRSRRRRLSLLLDASVCRRGVGDGVRGGGLFLLRLGGRIYDGGVGLSFLVSRRSCRSNGFGFLLARSEKRGAGQNAD